MDEASGFPTTPAQPIDIGMTVINNANIFASVIRRWNEKEPLEKTSTAFRLKLYKDQKSIKKSQPQKAYPTSASTNQPMPTPLPTRLM